MSWREAACKLVGQNTQHRCSAEPGTPALLRGGYVAHYCYSYNAQEKQKTLVRTIIQQIYVHACNGSNIGQCCALHLAESQVDWTGHATNHH